MSLTVPRQRRAARTSDADLRGVGLLGHALAALVLLGAVAGLLVGGGPGREDVETTRGVTVTLFGEGLYAADTWLVGAGNRGQDVALLLLVPLLVGVLRVRRRGPVAQAVLAGVLAFFAYFTVSMVFATAQNRLFPVYVAAASCAGSALLLVATRTDWRAVVAGLPARPGRQALVAYLLGVALALTVAWLPGMVATALTGDVAESVGPYTSGVTEALDLGLVVPVVVLAAVRLLQGRPSGTALAFVVLVLNVCIGVLLMGQGVGQLASGVPLTVGEVVAKMLTFAALTLVAGGLLARMWTSRPATGPGRS